MESQPVGLIADMFSEAIDIPAILCPLVDLAMEVDAACPANSSPEADYWSELENSGTDLAIIAQMKAEAASVPEQGQSTALDEWLRSPCEETKAAGSNMPLNSSTIPLLPPHPVTQVPVWLIPVVHDVTSKPETVCGLVDSSAEAQTRRQKGTPNPLPIQSASFTKDEVTAECCILYPENVTSKIPLVDIVIKSREWHEAQEGKFKKAAQTFIAETGDQQRVELAKLKAVMDMQRISELQRKQTK